MKKVLCISKDFIFVLIASLFLFSCSSIDNDEEEDINISPTQKMMLGDWLVVKSVFFINNNPTENPTDKFNYDEYIVSFLKTGETKEKINGFEKNGTYKVYDEENISWNRTNYRIFSLTKQEMVLLEDEAMFSGIGVQARVGVYLKRISL